MIELKFKKSYLNTNLLFLLIIIIAITAMPVYADDNNDEMLELIYSIKKTINTLDTRILSIEEKIYQSHNTSKEKDLKQKLEEFIIAPQSEKTFTSKEETITKENTIASSKTTPPVEPKSQPKTVENIKSKKITNNNNNNDADAFLKKIQKDALEVEKLNENDDIIKTKVTSTNTENKLICEITTKKLYNKNFNAASIEICGKTVINIKANAANLTPIKRAEIIADEIRTYLGNGGDIKQLLPVYREGLYIGDVNGKALFTVDKLSAIRSNMNRQQLTIAWVNNVRTALGAPKLQRLSYRYLSRSLNPGGRSVLDNTKLDFIPTNYKNKLVGMASWYGPGFHGRRAADGSRFNQNQLTAAHKSLKFGTVVKVTNLNNNKSCIVKITDRGPFIHGRIIDLSKAAAKEIGMLGSGVAKVQVDIIGKLKRI